VKEVKFNLNALININYRNYYRNFYLKMLNIYQFSITNLNRLWITIFSNKIPLNTTLCCTTIKPMNLLYNLSLKWGQKILTNVAFTSH